MTSSLSEADYQAIREISNNLVECRTQQDMTCCIGEFILPLFKAQSFGFGWTDMDFPALSSLEGLIIPGAPQDDLRKFPTKPVEQSLQYLGSIYRKFSEIRRCVIAHDIDIPREIFHREMAAFLADYPEYDTDQFPFFHLCKSIMATHDRTSSLSIGIHRHAPFDLPWKRRDLRLFEFIRPILIQTIRNIALNKQAAYHNDLIDALTRTSTPIALVDQGKRLVSANEPFRNLLSINLGQALPDMLQELLQSELDNCTEFSPSSPPDETTYYQHATGPFKLTANLINSQGQPASYLLRLKPADDAYSKVDLYLRTAEISQREMEITRLVWDGFVNQEIAERLGISLFTVKNHMRKIHQKLEVNTREQLAALLNRISHGKNP